MKKVENNKHTSTNINQQQFPAIKNTAKPDDISTTTQDSISINSNLPLVDNSTTLLYNRNINMDKVSAEKFINFSKVRVACKTVISEMKEENFCRIVGNAIMLCTNADELSELWHWSYEKSGATHKVIANHLPVKQFFVDIASIIKQKIDQKLIKGFIKFKNKDSEEVFSLLNKNCESNYKYKEASNDEKKICQQVINKYTTFLTAFNNNNCNLGSSLLKEFLQNFKNFFEHSEQEDKFDNIVYLANTIKLLNHDFQDYYIDEFEKFFKSKDDVIIEVKYAISIAGIYVDNYELDKAKPYVQKLDNFYQNLDINQRLTRDIGIVFSNFAEKALDYGNLSQSKEYYYKNWKIFADNKLIAEDKYTKNLNHECLLDKDNINFKEQINSWFYEATQRLVFCAVRTGDQSYSQELINYFNGTDIGALLNNIYSSAFNSSEANVFSVSNINEKNIPSQLQSLLISKKEVSKKLIQSIHKEIEKGTLLIEHAIEVLIRENKVGDARALFNKIPKDQAKKNTKLLQQGIYLAEVKKNLYNEIESYELASQPKAFLHFKAAEKFLLKPAKALQHINRATVLNPGNKSYQLLKQMITISMGKPRAESELSTDLNKKEQKVEETKAESVMPINAILAETLTEKNIEESANDEYILDDEGEAYYQYTANDQKKLHEHEQLRKKQEQVFLSNQNVKPEQKILRIAGEDILYSQTTEFTDIRGIKHRVYITKSVLEALGAESEQFLSAMNKGFVKPKGKNGIVYHGKNLIKVKTPSDTRIFTDKIYSTPEGISYIIFDRISNNHKETSRIARASTIETIAIKIHDNQKA